MVNFLIVFLASLPLIFRLIPATIPSGWLEPYAYWNAEVLNRGEDGRATTTWRNMGWWGGDSDVTYPQAGEALARKLLELADAPNPRHVLDIAHGAGDSLALHLSAANPPTHLHGLTSQQHETLLAQTLVDSLPHENTSIRLFTASASLRPGQDFDHPLNPLRLHLGKKRTEKASASESEDDDDGDVAEANVNVVDGKAEQHQYEAAHNDLDSGFASAEASSQPPPYDLIYILDAIYHFPPSIPYFLSSLLPVLRPGGTLAYTDILPPPNLSTTLAHVILSPLLSVPTRNLVKRPESTEEYALLLRKIGYTDIKVQDWTSGVFSGLAGDLDKRKFGWRFVASLLRRAERAGWRFVGVRARRPDIGEELARAPGQVLPPKKATMKEKKRRAEEEEQKAAWKAKQAEERKQKV